ncbi:hypothetical protein EON83_21385 [bacterium]|nr:MAG: hypothetical protein EON83_21385 [bacterium]
MPQIARYTAPATGGSGGAIVGRAKTNGGVILPGVPGFSPIGLGTNALNGSSLYYAPFIAQSSFSFDQFIVEVTTAGVSGANVAVALYNADADLLPTSLYLDGGTVATDTVGVKTLSVSSGTVPAGRYHLALLPSVTATFRAFRGGQDLAGLNPSLGTGYLVSFLTASRTASLGFPSTAILPGPTYSNQNFSFFALMRFTYS